MSLLSLTALIDRRTALHLAAAACATSVLPVAAQSSPSSAIEVRNAQGQPLTGAWSWRAPTAARMQFDVQGKFKSLPFQTKAQLDWLPQGQRYEAAQEVQIPVVGSRRQASVGRLSDKGLAPEIFIDRSRKESSATFDTSSGNVRFSRGEAAAPLTEGLQDRLSVFFQVAGMMAAAPNRYPQGTRFVFQAASTSRVAPWIFEVQARETLQLPAGRINAVRLAHHSDSGDDAGLQSHLWLAPSMGYLPVRIRLLEDGGRDELDLKLRSHTKP